MITIITKTKTIFVNDMEVERVEYDRMKGKASVYYPDTEERLSAPIIDYDDVTSVGFTSDAQPTSLVFNTKGRHDGAQ